MILLTCFGDHVGQGSSTTDTIHIRADTCSVHKTQGVGGNVAQLVDKIKYKQVVAKKPTAT